MVLEVDVEESGTITTGNHTLLQADRHVVRIPDRKQAYDPRPLAQSLRSSSLEGGRDFVERENSDTWPESPCHEFLRQTQRIIDVPLEPPRSYDGAIPLSAVNQALSCQFLKRMAHG